VGKLIRAAAILVVLAAASCDSGTLITGSDADCGGSSCADADASGVDPCETIQCPVGQTCRDARCRTADPCASVVCTNPGEVCDPRDGSCRSGAADDDLDGVTIAGGDCDDGDASIRPGATEVCDGIDQDCDHEVDDGFPDADGDEFDTCGFGNPAQADCDDSDPSAHPGGSEDCDGDDEDCDGANDEGLDPRPCSTECGDGEERCEGGAWSVCSAPAECDCAPVGAAESEGCGSCGSRSHTCEADLTWSDWGPCDGEGLCVPGRVDTQPCGVCGSQERTCSDECDWTEWADCEGEGVCEPTRVESQPCGSCGHQERSCTAGCVWSDWSGCLGEGACAPAQVGTQPCGNCGTQQRTCTASCAWGDWGACTGEGICVPSNVETRSCGNCGTQQRTCTASCAWTDWAACTGEGPCAAGSSGSCTTTCGSAGTQSCNADCSWGACSPPGETCNGADDDCDGQCDEGCRVGVHRSVNAAGDHFYTVDAGEAACCGYTVESYNYFYISTTAVAGTTGLYRCLVPAVGDHFCSTSPTCEGVTWEGLMGYIASSASCGAVALYRLVNPGTGDHFHTTSAAERDLCLGGGWIDEGVTGYVWTSP
jgi:hypothetical protein